MEGPAPPEPGSGGTPTATLAFTPTLFSYVLYGTSRRHGRRPLLGTIQQSVVSQIDLLVAAHARDPIEQSCCSVRLRGRFEHRPRRQWPPPLACDAMLRAEVEAEAEGLHLIVESGNFSLR